MLTEFKTGGCVEVRTVIVEDLPRVLSLLGRAELPTAGVADALPDFIVAESDSRLVGVVGLELYRDSALLRSAAAPFSRWRPMLPLIA